MFRKLVAVYREFAIDGRRAEEVVKEMLYLSDHLGIMDVKLEEAILKANPAVAQFLIVPQSRCCYNSMSR